MSIELSLPWKFWCFCHNKYQIMIINYLKENFYKNNLEQK